MNFRSFFLLAGLLFASVIPFAQDKLNVKFGDVTEKDFAQKVYAIDSNANAVVIADVGYSKIEGNQKNWFSLVHKRFKRIHILNKNGYDMANVSISLYASSSGDYEEKLDKLKAVTYNLENGKVVETKLDVKSSVFKDKISKNRVVKKFTFPNVKEGSIIEFEYTTTSDYIEQIDPWLFQGEHPVLWSELNFSVPDFLGYVFLTKGYLQYHINDRKQRQEIFTVLDSRGIGATERTQFSSNVADYRWVIKNAPALKEENFTSSIRNHIQQIEFPLSEQRQPLRYYRYIESWPQMADKLMQAESFGQQLTKDNSWMKDITRPLKESAKSKTELAKTIFSFVRDNYTSTGRGNIFLQQSLKNLGKSKNGTASELNLLLTALLKHEDIEAYPVILSTKSNGFSYSLYPLVQQYDYIIASAIIDGKVVYLDASEPRLGFGHLPVRCYNGHARIINKAADPIELLSDSLMERKNTSVFVINDDKGNIVGSMMQTPGYYESLSLRDRIKEKGKDQLVTDIKKAFGHEMIVSNFVVDSLDKYEEVLGIKYDFDFTEEKEDIIYLNPMFGEGYKENPFKSAERFYPVEMPYGFDETYTLQMDVPTGYVVDELPQSIVVKLNEENEGMFEYRISQSGSGVSFRSRIRISRANFMPEEYEMLREFFNLVVKKQAEQIVFKKKK